MPTFDDPTADAREASEALRALAQSTRSFDDPSQTYPVVGELLAATRHLSQVLDQLATAHTTNQARARDDHGNTLIGAHAAQAAATALRRASGLLDDAGTRLDSASQHSGRIAWDPPPTTSQASQQRWISVVFLQGSETEEIFDVIDTNGPQAAIEQLTGFDYRTETTDAAMEDGHVYDHPPAGSLDRETEHGQYRMVHNSALGHIGLYRQHIIDPADQLPEPPTQGLLPQRHLATGLGRPRHENAHLSRSTTSERTAAARAPNVVGGRAGRSPQENAWFTHQGPTNSQQPRGVEL